MLATFLKRNVQGVFFASRVVVGAPRRTKDGFDMARVACPVVLLGSVVDLIALSITRDILPVWVEVEVSAASVELNVLLPSVATR